MGKPTIFSGTVIGILFFLFILATTIILTISYTKIATEPKFERGKKQAEIDVHRGKFIVYQNRFAGSSQTYRDLMLRKYKVEIIEGGDAVSHEDMAFNSGYNSVSIPAIEKKYGKGIIEKVEKELEKKAEKKRKVEEEKIVNKGSKQAKKDIENGKIIVYYDDSKKPEEKLINELSRKHRIMFIPKPRYENLPFYSGYNETSLKEIKENIRADVFLKIKFGVKFIAIDPFSIR